MNIPENINQNYLKSIGFRELYDYRIKRNRENYLVWSNLFKAGEFIRINLSFKNSRWVISDVIVQGEETKELYEKYLQNEEIIDVIGFVKLFPSSTF